MGKFVVAEVDNTSFVFLSDKIWSSTQPLLMAGNLFILSKF